MTIRTENYYLDLVHPEEILCPVRHTTIAVPSIKATDEYAARIQEERRSPRRPLKERVTTIHRQIITGEDRPPLVHQVDLHPDVDILYAGGPLGTTWLNEPKFDGLPNRLEDFDDEQMVALLGKYLAPPEELLEFQAIEQHRVLT